MFAPCPCLRAIPKRVLKVCKNPRSTLCLFPIVSCLSLALPLLARPLPQGPAHSLSRSWRAMPAAQARLPKTDSWERSLSWALLGTRPALHMFLSTTHLGRELPDSKESRTTNWKRGTREYREASWDLEIAPAEPEDTAWGGGWGRKLGPLHPICALVAILALFLIPDPYESPS